MCRSSAKVQSPQRGEENHPRTISFVVRPSIPKKGMTFESLEVVYKFHFKSGNWEGNGLAYPISVSSKSMELQKNYLKGNQNENIMV